MPTPLGNFVSGSRGADSAVPSVPSHWPNAAVVSSSGSGGGAAAFCYEFASQGASIARAHGPLCRDLTAPREQLSKERGGKNPQGEQCAAFSRHTLLSALTRPTMPLEPLFWERDFQRACLGARSLRPARPAKERNFTAALLAGQPASLRAHSPLYRRSAPTTLSAAVSHAYQHEAVECEREREVHGQVQQVLHAGGRTCRAQTTIAYRGLGRHGQSTFSFLQMPFFACAPQSSNGEPLNPWNKSTSMHGRGGGFVAMYTKICNAHGFNRSNNRDRRPVRDGMRTGMLACPPLSACCALVRVAVPCRRWGSSRASESDRATLLFRPASTRRAATSC